VGNGATSGTRAVLFNKTAMDGASLTSLMTGTVTNNLINYLRGDSSLEASAVNVSNPGAIYRERQTRLGDIVNSTPVFVKGDLDQKYDTVPGATGYRAFVTAKIAQRKEGVLFVGGNDGMLHAFRDGATVSGGNSPTASPGGVEVFAYVPRAILPTINQLADKAYVHRYYVDGPSAEADAFLPTANRWANMVLGSTGAGAGAVSSAGVSPRTGVFAIDATNLSTSVTSLGASSVAWEVGSNLAAFGELGYVLSKIQAGPTLDGSWVAIFGNGYESASCKAQLFIVNIETGALIKKIDTGAGNCSTAKNGLGGVTVVRNSSQQIIGAYAGDLLGNAWKFNLNSSSSSNWKVDFGGDPLYKTRTGQPITAAPSVIDLATTPTVTTPKPGYMVVFETGKFYEDADLSTTTTQTIYGTWDATAFGASATATGIARVAESNLVARTQASIADGTNQITYSTSTKGWYYNFTHSGERMIYPMNVVLNRFVSGTSLTPTTSVTSDPCVSGSGGEGRPYFIDALSGAFIPFPLDPVIPPEPPPPPFDDCKTDPTKCTVKFITSDPLAPPGIDISCIKTNTCPPTATKNLKRRQWRQLFVR
jgi:type IV pilus assembly protein PilY1